MKALYLICGYVSLSLGIVGIFLPLLPTTPFLLLSAACFLRSSDSLYRWITGHRIFGEYIKNYHRFRAVSKRAKIAALVTLWLSIALSVWLIHFMWLRIMLVAIAVCVSVYIVRLRTLTPDMAGGKK